MKRRGRPPKTRACDTLKECLETANTTTGTPWKLVLGDRVCYVWATSNSSAIYLAARHWGMTCDRVLVSEMVEALRGEEGKQP